MRDCPSGAGQCDHNKRTGQLCDICQKSEDDYLEMRNKEALDRAIRILQSRGYTVTPPQS